jgi:hypothetical protein
MPKKFQVNERVIGNLLANIGSVPGFGTPKNSPGNRENIY